MASSAGRLKWEYRKSAKAPKTHDLRKVLILCLNIKKSAHQMLSNTYFEVTISERRSQKWVQHFKNVNSHVENRINWVEGFRSGRNEGIPIKIATKIKENWHD